MVRLLLKSFFWCFLYSDFIYVRIICWGVLEIIMPRTFFPPDHIHRARRISSWKLRPYRVIKIWWLFIVNPNESGTQICIWWAVYKSLGMRKSPKERSINPIKRRSVTIIKLWIFFTYFLVWELWKHFMGNHPFLIQIPWEKSCFSFSSATPPKCKMKKKEMKNM